MKRSIFYMQDFYLFAVIVIMVNLLGLYLTFFSLGKLPANALRHSLVFYMISILIWSDLSMLARLPWIDRELTVVLSRLAISFSLVLLNSLMLFLLLFSGYLGRLKVLFTWYAFLALSLLLFFITLMTPYVLSDIRIVDYKIHPDYNWLYYLLVAFVVLYSLWVLAVTAFSFIRSGDELYRLQFIGIFITNCLALLTVVAFNGILPIFMERILYFPIGPLASLFSFSGFLYVLHRGRYLLLGRDMNHLLSRPIFNNVINIFSLRKIFRDIPKMLTDQHLVTESYDFLSSYERRRIFLTVAKKSRAAPEQLTFESLMMPEWRPLDSASPKSTSLPVLHSKQRPLKYKESYDPMDYSDILATTVANNRKMFGCDLICFSQSLFRSLQGMYKLVPSRSPIILLGESGSGRSLLAQAIHYARTGLRPVEISTADTSFSQKIFDFEHDPNTTGLIVKNINQTPQRKLLLLFPLLDNLRKYVYLAIDNYYNAPVNYEDHFFSEMKMRSFIVEVEPLRERSADIFYYIMYVCCFLSNGPPIKTVSSKALQQAFAHTWPGNFPELRHAIEAASIEMENYNLDRLPLSDLLPDDSLSTMEKNEKNLILKALSRNSFRRIMTAKELGITLNTLKNKIRKYSIDMMSFTLR